MQQLYAGALGGNRTIGFLEDMLGGRIIPSHTSLLTSCSGTTSHDIVGNTKHLLGDPFMSSTAVNLDASTDEDGHIQEDGSGHK